MLRKNPPDTTDSITIMVQKADRKALRRERFVLLAQQPLSPSWSPPTSKHTKRFPPSTHIFNLLHFQPQPHSVTAVTAVQLTGFPYLEIQNLSLIQGSGENTFCCGGFRFWIRHRHCHPRHLLTPSTLPSWIHMTGDSSAWMYRPRNSTKDCGQKSNVSERRRRH